MEIFISVKGPCGIAITYYWTFLKLKKNQPYLCIFYCFTEDFDEHCDPKSPKTINYDKVKTAASAIRNYLQPTPLVASHASKKFKTHIFYKPEIMQKTGSFKERGCLYALLNLTEDLKKVGVVIASLGNEAVSMSYYCIKLKIPLLVVLPVTVPISYQQRCQGSGVKFVYHGNNLEEAMKYARSVAREKGLTYINGRDHPDVLTGHATMALEILAELPAVDAIVVPVGSGGLAAAIGTVVKKDRPNCLIYGVQPEATPLFFKTLEVGEEEYVPLIENDDTMAHSIAVTSLGVNAMASVKPFIDKMLLVKEDWIAQAMLHLYETQYWVVEGAAACPLAAVIGGLVPEFKTKNVVMILTGGNVNPILFSRCIDRGLSAEGRLVKFNVMIPETNNARNSLFGLLKKGNYCLVNHKETHRWFNGEEFLTGISITCMTENLEHAVEMKRIVEKAFPNNVTFETAPYNDKRVCPCFLHKRRCTKTRT